MTQNEDYWKDLCVPFDLGNNEIARTRIDLNSLSIERLHTLNSSFFFTPQINDKSKLIDQIIHSKEISDYIRILNFSKGRKDLLIEFFKKPKFNFLKDSDFLFDYISLLKVFKKDPLILFDALLYCEYKKRQRGDEYIFTPVWTNKDYVTFDGSIQGLKSKVARQYKGKKFIEVRNFDDGEHHYYVFQREKKKRIAESFQTNVSLVGKSDFFLRISEDGKFFDLKCNDGSLRELVASHITQNCNKTLIYRETKPESKDLNKVVKEMLTEVPDNLNNTDLILEEAVIRKTIHQPRNCLRIGKEKGPDIRTTMKAINDQSIADLSDKDNISFIKVGLDGINVGITFKKSEDSSFKFEVTTTNLPDEKLSKIIKKIEDSWNIKLNQIYAPPLDDECKKHLFDKFLSFDGRSPLTTDEKTFLSEIVSKKIITSNIVQIWKCCDKREHIYYQAMTSCPLCGGKMELQKEVKSTSINTFGIKSYVREMLKLNFGDDNISESKRTYRKETYCFFRVNVDNTFVYVYIDYGRNISTFMEFALKSYLPIIVVSVLKPLKGDIDNNTSSNIILKDMYIDNAKSHFKNGIINLKSNAITKISNASKASRDSLNNHTSQNAQYSKDELEDDTFNILKYIFRTGEKWGKEKTGETYPEGVIGYTTYFKKRKIGFKEGKFTFIWDCKFHGGTTTYNFTRAEIDKARRYIKQANTSDAITKFSGMLNVYINFCNKYNITQYKNFSDSLYNTKQREDWNGRVVLFDLDTLTSLYDYIKKDEMKFFSKHPLFLMLFSKMIEESTPKTYFHITKTEISNLIVEFEKSIIPTDLDVASLSETFERDEY